MTMAAPKLKECPWYEIGLNDDPDDPNSTPLYIIKAFQIANEHAPNLKFIYNHHENPEATASWELIKIPCSTAISSPSPPITRCRRSWK